MPRIEIGIGAIIAGIAGLGLATEWTFNAGLLVLGALLLAHGAYDVYYKPNFNLDKTLRRWLERHYWRVTPADDIPADKFVFGLRAEDEAHRMILISREREVRGLLAFTARVELDDETLENVGRKLDTAAQQRLYEDLHVLLASMHLGYTTTNLTKMTVRHALPIDEHLSEHAVDMKAKEVANGVAAARSLVRRTVV